MISDLLKSLEKSKYDQIMYSFEQGYECVIQLPKGMFIGVNMLNKTKYTIIEEAGAFSYGTIK